MPGDQLPTRLEDRFSELVGRVSDTAVAHGRKPAKGNGQSYMACCPAHDDHHPSLSLAIEGSRILVHCFAGCTAESVVESVGFPMEALFDDWRQGNGAARPRLVWDRNRKAELAREAREFAESLYEPVDRIPLPPSLSDFQALPYPPIKPILGPWASQQINLVFAPSGAGKTMFGLSLAYAMAEGRDWLGWTFQGEPRTVLYVDGEMAARMMQERFGPLKSERLHIANIPGWWADEGRDALNLATEAGQDVLTIWTEGLGADVVVLDNFMSLAWRDGTSFSSDEIWTPFKRWCTAARAKDRCVIMVDHANVKGGVFGTKTKLNIMDLVAEMEPLEEADEDDPQGAWVRFRFSKTRGYRDSLDIVNQRDVQIGAVGSEWNRRSPAEEFANRLRSLRKDGMTIREIAKELNVSYSKVQRAWRRIQILDSPDSPGV